MFYYHFVSAFVVLSSKHPSAAQMLRDVGAVDFLTQLSPSVEPRLRAVIDGTLDQLFQLPELLPSHSAVYSHRPHCTTPTGVAELNWIFVCVENLSFHILYSRQEGYCNFSSPYSIGEKYVTDLVCLLQLHHLFHQSRVCLIWVISTQTYPAA